MDLSSIIKTDELRAIWEDGKKRSYVIIGGAVIFSLVYVFLLVVPGVNNFNKLAASKGKISAKLSAARKDIESIDDLKGKLEKLKEEYNSYAAQIPGKREIAIFLDSLASIAGESGVRILSVTPTAGSASGGTASADPFTDMMVAISAKGGYNEVSRFVRDLERGKGFSSIRDIRIQYDPKSPFRHDADIVLKVYVSTKDDIKINDEKKQ